MTPRARHDTILRHLRREGSATVADLAAEVGASRRTVLRDVGALREQGFLIHAEAGRGGGLQLDAATARAVAPLTVTEVFAMIVGIAAMRAARALPFADLADAGLAKIERALPPDRLRDLRRLMGCLHVGRLSPLQDLSDTGPMDPDLLPAFETAFLSCAVLTFSYRDAHGRESLRKVEPQALLILPPLWYLVAWDPARADFRHFRMDRISAPAVLAGATFRRRHVPFADDVCPWAGLPR
jgi:predicted DNA-binding transcriptional regulator YafY